MIFPVLEYALPVLLVQVTASFIQFIAYLVDTYRLFVVAFVFRILDIILGVGLFIVAILRYRTMERRTLLLCLWFLHLFLIFLSSLFLQKNILFLKRRKWVNEIDVIAVEQPSPHYISTNEDKV